MRGRAAGFALVSAVCMALYWPGLLAWFSMDDFAWLGLRLTIASPGDIISTLFSPMAQGTIRPFSERAYFLGLEWLFGLQALPFRLVAFAVQLANVWLAIRLAERVTGSRAAGVAGSLFWIANSALALAMSWSSAFNQILWPFFILAGCHARWSWLTTGSRRARWAEWAFFLLGFGALELQVVYPVIAGALTLLYHRERWRDLPPLFTVAAAYAVFNRSVAHPQASPVYKLYWDTDILATFGNYLRMATGMWRPAMLRPADEWWVAAECIVGVGFAAALLWLAWKRDRFAAFGLVWFLVTLAPILPLKNHVSDYYLTVPVLGLALAAGRAAVQRPIWAILPVLLYCTGSGYWARRVVVYHYEGAERIRVLVAGVQEAARLHPGKIILLTAVSSEQYWSGMNDNPFRLLPGVQVYLAPGAEENIEKHPDLGDPADFVLVGPAARKAVERGDALVYSPAGGKLRNVTAIWGAFARERWADSLATTIDLGQPFLEKQLESGWHDPEHDFRWSKGRAVVRLGAPGSAKELYMTVYRETGGSKRAEITLVLRINGKERRTWELEKEKNSFSFSVPLPDDLDREDPATLEFLISPTLSEEGTGGRELGLAFGRIGLR